MSAVSPRQWEELSPFLDQALTLNGAERARWLAALREQNSTLADRLEVLLNEHHAVQQEQFLEQRPAQFPASSGLTGQTIGRYRMLSLIGQGGMSTVWLAERGDGRFEGQVAVKLLNLALVGKAGQARFKREGSILGRLTHPHIAHLMDAGISASGQPYLVLEHVRGEHIDQYCDRRGLDVEARVRLFLDVLAAVAHAHANLIVHRDLKPSNVLVRTDGQIKLLDFGVAKLLEEEGQAGAASLLTREAGAALTPEYAAPEQVTGSPVTTATDVYSLGVLLHVLLSGQHPAGPGPHSAADLVKAVVDTDPPRLSEVVGTGTAAVETATANAAKRATTPDKLRRLLRGDLDTIVAKALKKNPQERYVSVTALAEDIRHYLASRPITARPDTFSYRAAKFVRRNRGAVTLATLAFVAVIASVAGTLLQARTARTERDFAIRQLSRAEAINDLNSFLLSDAAPSGKPFTVNELLRRAEQIVARQPGENDINRVELLISIGRQYWIQDEDIKARKVLEQAYTLSRVLHDPSTRAKAACALASSLARGSELPRAEALFQGGLNQLPEQSRFVLDRIFCLQRGSEVAGQNGAPQEAIARMQAAQQLLKESPFRSELMDVSTLMGLAESYRIAGQHREASDTFEQASAQLAALGRDETQAAGTLFNNWGVALSQMGQPREAEKVFRRAINVSQADKTEETVSPMLLINHARVLRELARVDEAADYAQRAHAKALRAGDQVVINQSLLELARIYRDQHDLVRAAAVLAEVEPRLQRNLPAGHIAFASLASEQALIAQARGNLGDAMTFANQAMAIAEASVKAGRQGADFLPNLLVRRADLQLQLHQPDKAAADAARSVTMLQRTAQPGTFSSTLGRAYLASGRALQAQGKHDEARAAFRSAVEQLQDTLGPDHPETRHARYLAQ